MVLITETDWSLFCEEWNASEDKGISAEIVVASSLSKLDGSCENIPIFVEGTDEHMNEANDGTDVGKLLIRTYPQVNEGFGLCSRFFCVLLFFFSLSSSKPLKQDSFDTYVSPTLLILSLIHSGYLQLLYFQ